MTNYKDMMDRWKAWRFDEAVQQDANLSFKVMGIRNNDMVIEGKKVRLVLSFKGDDLKKAVEGKGNKKGKVTLASVNIK
tara:strand:+ start:130 stop:366 length:237 start_codon:yes stop_codon:yes gene_type:complete